MNQEPDPHRLSERQINQALSGTALAVWNWSVPTQQFVINFYETDSPATDQPICRVDTVEELIYPDDLSAFKETIDTCLKQNRPFEIDHRIKIHDDSWKWVSTRGRVVEQNDNGAPLHIAGVCRDIKPHTSVNNGIADSESSYQIILARISDTVLITDDAGKFKYICPNIHVIFGYTDDEVQSMGHIRNLIGIDLLERYQPGTFTEITNIEHHITDKSGVDHILLVNMKACSIRGGTVLFTCRDITERRQIEETLHRSEELYRIMVDTAQEGIWVLDNNNTTTYANQRLADIFGYSADEMIGMAIFQFLDEELHPEVARKLDERQKYGSIQTERKWRQKSGTDVWTIVSANNLYDAQGVQIGTLALVTDITERKRAEEALRISEERLRSFVESFGDFIFVFDAEDRYIDYYLPRDLDNVYMKPELFLGKSDQEIMPEHFLELTKPLVKELRRTGKPQQFEYWLTIGGQQFWFAAQITCRLDAQGQYIGRTQVARNITARKQAEDRLKHQYRFQRLLINLATRFINIPSEQFDSAIMDALREVGEFVGGIRSIVNVLNEKGTHFTRVYEWHAPQIQALQGITAPMFDYATLTRRLETGESLIMTGPDDLLNWPELAHEFKKAGVQAGVLVPLIRGGRLREVVSITFSQPLAIEPEAIDLLRVVGEIYQNAVERKERDEKLRTLNLELEQRIEERTAQLSDAVGHLQAEVAERKQAQDAEHEQRRLAEALYDTAAALNSTLRLDEVLDRILINIDHVVKHDVANIMLLEDGTVRVVRFRGYPTTLDQSIIYAMRFTLPTTANLQWMATERKPLLIPDTHHYTDWVRIPELEWLHSYLGVPICHGDEVLGFFALDSAIPNFFTLEHAQRLKAFADQAAIAIKNAQLFEQANTLAALEERQRLARELHDSVSQMLFSANSIAESLPRILERHPEKASQYIADLHNFTRTAMSEMRSLLIELRPEALTRTELGFLLIQLSAAFASRTQIKVDNHIESGLKLPAEIQIAFYRIAQEALNNIAKYADATTISMGLQQVDDSIEMKIQDNGKGFEPADISADHFGLQIMKERAVGVGAEWDIHSRPGAGTEIIVRRKLHD
jgi:PAS domain S-box-containing protein